jgi:AraC family transcriptional regulator
MEHIPGADARLPGAPDGANGSGVMNVTYHPRVSDFGEERVLDRIQIIVPGERAALCASCRTADGHERTAPLRGHQVAVIPARRPHAIFSGRPGDGHIASDALVIGLDEEFFLATARAATGARAPRLMERHAAVDPFLREVGNGLRNALAGQGGLYLESLSTVVAVHLARNYCEPPTRRTPGAGLAPAKVARVHAFIAERIRESLRVEQLAATVHISPFHFARLFKQATGHSPHVYLTVQRVEHAKHLLKTTDLPLVEVGARAGFQTQGHFTGVFHRYAGLTPRVFRLNARRQAAEASTHADAGIDRRPVEAAEQPGATAPGY